MEQEKYNNKYSMHFEPGSNPTIFNDAKFEISGDFYATSARDLKDKQKNSELKGYFKSEEFRDGIKKVTDWIKQHSDKKWAHVYYFLRRHGLEEMSKTRFGEIVHDNGGPSAKTVYSSGKYDLTEEQQKNGRELFDWVKHYFPNIDKKQ